MTTIEREHVAPVVAPVTTRDVLHRAADLLEEFGWCQKTSARDADGNACAIESLEARFFCALGSVYRASLDLGDWDVGERACDALGPRVALWNDQPERHRDHVVARLREAAETA